MAYRGALGLLEVLDELDILEDVALRGGEAREEVVLEADERYGELAELRHERLRLLLQVGPLVLHHERQQLVLEALFCDAKVDQRRLHAGSACCWCCCCSERASKQTDDDVQTTAAVQGRRACALISGL